MTVTNYTWDPLSDNVLMESDENGDTIAMYTNEPVQYGKLISQHRDGVTTTYHFDGMDNTTELTDEAGSVTDTYRFSAFGEEIAKTGTTVNPFGYQGAIGFYSDPDSTIYVRARHYSRATSTWTTRDPLGFIDGPNVYSFEGNDPINMSDPSGLTYFNCCEDWERFRKPRSTCSDAHYYPMGPGPDPSNPGGYAERGERCCNALDRLIARVPSFRRLMDCAVQHNCLAKCRVFCQTGCSRGRAAGYVPPFGYLRGYIYVCDSALWPNAGDMLLEEAYHALSICERGNGIGAGLDTLRRHLSGLPTQQVDCGKCLGRELLAKRCASRPAGCRTALSCIGPAMSSCSHHCAFVGPQSLRAFMSTALGIRLNRWYSTVDSDCDEIDTLCGVV